MVFQRRPPMSSEDIPKHPMRAWTFTINNPTWSDHFSLVESPFDYVIFGLEVGEEGTTHYQCYLYHHSKARFSAIKKHFPRAHIEYSLGTIEQNYDYCSKDGNFVEIGDKPRQGTRNDFDEVREALESLPFEEVAQQHFTHFLRYGRSMRDYVSLIQTHRTTKPYVKWVYGPTGVGKTSSCISSHKSFYIKDSTKWWDGYSQQEAIIIDDFDGTWPFRDLLRLLDFNPYQGQVKGGYVKINSPYIYITCDRSPQDLYEGQLTPHELSQLLRRINNVLLLEKCTEDIDGMECHTDE